jgi:DNA-binding response OmpR family regulator
MKKILIIEDEPDVASSIKMYLEKAGYEAQFTLDPKDGISRLKDFDLLLLDLIMPKLSGRAVLKEMKKQKLDKPVVVLSAVGLPQMIGEELAKDYPGIIFVAKTAMTTQLLPAIKELLKG